MIYNKSIMIEEKEEKVDSIKLIVVGDTEVGKTSIIKRFVKSNFNEFEEPTLGAVFF